MKLVKRTSLLILSIIFSNNCFSQNVFYYGPDSSHHYYPSDIIETQNGDFIVTSDVNYAGFLMHNVIFNKHVFRINSGGDTIWTLNHSHTNQGGRILEANDGTILTLGSVDGSHLCGTSGQTSPYSDYNVYSYTATGVLQSNSVFSDDCNDGMIDYKKRDDGGIIAVHAASGLFPENYSVKELSPSGQLTTMPFPSGIIGGGLIEKNSTGFWILQYYNLYRVGLSGNILWQDSITNNPYLSDFIKVNNDSILISSSNPYAQGSGFTYLVKLDSSGNTDWTRNFYMKTEHLAKHSSGNYILTGTYYDDLRVMLVSPNGDSIWSNTHTLLRPAVAIKTIEASDTRIVTLAHMDSYFTNFQGMCAVVFDSINLALTSISVIGETNLEVNFYPNPSNKTVTFNIDTDKNDGEYFLEIYSVLGVEVFSSYFTKSNFKIDLVDLEKGIYFVNVRTKKGEFFKSKLIVNGKF